MITIYFVHTSFHPGTTYPWRERAWRGENYVLYAIVIWRGGVRWNGNFLDKKWKWERKERNKNWENLIKSWLEFSPYGLFGCEREKEQLEMQKNFAFVHKQNNLMNFSFRYILQYWLFWLFKLFFWKFKKKSSCPTTFNFLIKFYSHLCWQFHSIKNFICSCAWCEILFI